MGIKEELDQWIKREDQLLSEGKFDEAAQLQDEDAVRIVPKFPPAVGRKAVAELTVKWMEAAKAKGMDFSTAKVCIMDTKQDGDLALQVGTWTIGSQKGSYVYVFKKAGGDWKMKASSWSED